VGQHLIKDGWIHGYISSVYRFLRIELWDSMRFEQTTLSSKMCVLGRAKPMGKVLKMIENRDFSVYFM